MVNFILKLRKAESTIQSSKLYDHKSEIKEGKYLGQF